MDQIGRRTATPWRRLASLVPGALALLLLACGGDDDPAAPQFPSVAGTYAIAGSFDDLPGTTVSGPLTLAQTDLASGALTGTVTLTLRTSSGPTSTVSGLFNAAITTAGNITFSVGSPSGSSSWAFAGTVATGGAMAGRHTLRGVCGTCPGPWAAAKQ